ncbi:CPBP family intramembrane metalloprotease [Candidatus Daviesbacteria bacterium]|nr:CPBP family intramembrane metalloprotease [Candidatus Daviesbacteria bacterium]
MPEIDRRRFVKAGLAIVAGIAVESAVLPIKVGAAVGLEKLSSQKAGNASIHSETEEGYSLTEYQRYQYQLGLPVTEELIFRAIPSYILSKREGVVDPFEETVRGTGGLRMTRREMIWGSAASVFFALPHSITPKGFDTRIIPLPQFIGGLSKWYLQRKFGIIANISAHVFNNSLAIWVTDKLSSPR